MKRHLLALVSGAACLALLVSLGCKILPEPQPDFTRYFTLSLPAGAEMTPPAPAKGSNVGLRPIEVAPFLRKGSLAVREGESEIRYDDSARWAEPLDAGVSRVLRTCLQADPRIARVLTAPFPFEVPRDYDVLVRIAHAEGQRADGRAAVRFLATVEIVRPGDAGEVVARKTFDAPDIAWDGQDPAALARGLSEAARLLAAEIAALLPAKK